MEGRPAIEIYNTLTGRLEEFTPITPGEVRIYVCGVTVYDECHIGHARSAFIFDVIRRYLKYRGYKVRFVRNITDIDDKIINKAREETTSPTSALYGCGLEEASAKIAEHYTKSFYEDMDALGIERPDEEPKATAHIQDMIRVIGVLISKGYAYASGGDVYFEVRKHTRYGQLSHQNLEQMLEGSRIDVSEKKRDPLDFALWKAAKENEPKWDSPWGPGRPGWHIECSVMSTKFLGETFDIHGGGRDLIFPHHENEIAQSECANGKPFARYWIHNGLLTINGEKMAKSLGNFVSLKDVLSRYPADVLKLFFLGAHYSNPIDFSWGNMKAANRAYNDRFTSLLQKIEREIGPEEQISTSGGDFKVFKDRFETAMDDNFNTPSAIGALFDLASFCYRLLSEKPAMYEERLKYGMDMLKGLGAMAGLCFKAIPKDISDLDIETKIAARDTLRKQRKFKEADEIRQGLEEKGIILEDTKGKTHWRRAG